MFSSTTALWGSAHLAHYAAANLFLGAVAHHRHSLGLPATTIDWGLWEQAGDTEADDYQKIRAATHAERPGLWRSSGPCWPRSVVQEAVADVDWSVLKPAYEVRGTPAAAGEGGFETSAGRSEEETATKRDDLEALRAAAPEDRLELLSGLVTQDVARVLGLDPERDLDDERGFFDVGMDSLTAMELKRRLEARIGGQLPDTLTFNYPTVGKLSRRLYQNRVWRRSPTKAELRQSSLRRLCSPRHKEDDRSEEELLSLLANKVRKTS